jgi:hypothetical protein
VNANEGGWAWVSPSHRCLLKWIRNCDQWNVWLLLEESRYGEIHFSHAQPGDLEATDSYPPLRAGLGRNHPAAISEFDAITSGKDKDISPRTDAIERL